MPQISVVMSVYNGEEFLREAVDCILNQTFTDFEFLIVDDGSIDNTWPMLTAYAQHDPRIILMRNEQNIGYRRSLNKALKQSRGQYIARQDADDVSYPERFARQVAFLEQNPQVGLVGTRFIFISDDGLILGESNLPTGNAAIQQQLLRANCFMHASIMLRAELLSAVGGQYRPLDPSEDYDMWLQLAEITEVANLPEYLCAYRVQSNQVSFQNWYKQAACAQTALDLAQQRRATGTDALKETGNTTVTLSEPQPELLLDVCLRYAQTSSQLGNWPQAETYLAHAAEYGFTQPDWLAWALPIITWIDHQFGPEQAGESVKLMSRHTPAALGDAAQLEAGLYRTWWSHRQLTEAYRAYQAGNPSAASENFKDAIAPNAFPNENYLFEWLIDHARLISKQAQSYKAGVNFISTLFSAVNGSAMPLKEKTLGAFLVTTAFESHSKGELQLVRRQLLGGIQHDKRWLLNSGVLSIGLDAMLGDRMVNLKRRIKGEN